MGWLAGFACVNARCILGDSLGDKVARILAMVRAVEDVITVLLVAAMVILSTGQIVFRDVWHRGLVWADPTLRVMVLWVAMLGAMAATRSNNHITVDVLSRMLSPRVRRFTQRITSLFAAGVSGLIAYEGARFVLMEFQDGTTVFSRVPSWCCELIIPIGFAVIALRFLLLAYRPPVESE